MAIRKNTHKVEWHRLPLDALEVAAMVLQFSSTFKYQDATPDRANWESPPYFHRNVLVDSLARHTAAIHAGELFDPEDSLLHSAHKVCNALFELAYDIRGYFDGLTTEQARERMNEMRARWLRKMDDEVTKKLLTASSPTDAVGSINKEYNHEIHGEESSC